VRTGRRGAGDSRPCDARLRLLRQVSRDRRRRARFELRDACFRGRGLRPESPSLVLLSEGPEHWGQLRAEIESGRIAGPRVHDARIAALCLAHGVRELWTADRDFSRYPSLATVNPLSE